MISGVKASEYAYSESYYSQAQRLLEVRIIKPTYSYPFVDVKEGDFIYPVLDVNYNGTNVTDLAKENFTVEIGTKEALINNVSYDPSTSYYKLNVTVPYNEAGSKQDFWINVSYEGIWTTDIQVESVIYFAPKTTVATTVSGGGGGGPVGVPTTLPKKDFSLDKDFIQVMLTQGESKKDFVTVKNTGEVDLNLTMRIQNLQNFISFQGKNEINFKLKKGESKIIELSFSASEKQETGVFPGRIIFTSDSLEKKIIVVIEVQSAKPLFDVKVEIPPQYLQVHPGESVLAKLTLYNLGKIGRVDVDVEYGIKSLTGNLTISKHEIIAVETQVSTLKSVDLPPDLKPDDYVFYAKVSYNGVVGTGSAMFRVIKKVGISMITVFLIALILVLILIVLFLIVRVLKRKFKLRKKRRKRKVKS